MRRNPWLLKPVIYIHAGIFTLLCITQTTLAQSDESQQGLQAIQVHLGSQGVGAAYRYGISDKFSARLGGSIIPVNLNNVYNLSSFQSKSKLSASFTSVHILADFTPLHNLPWLKLTFGGAYFIKANGKATLTPTGNYDVGNYKISNEDVGILTIDVDWNGPAPYLGLNLLNAFPRNRFNVNLDLGSYYLPKPKSTITGTKMLSDNSALEPQLNSNLKDYRWLPVLQINFNYKLGAY